MDDSRAPAISFRRPTDTGIGEHMAFVIRLGIGVLFLTAGSAKIAAPYDFLSNVYAYGMLGPRSGYVVAWSLPWIEVVLGLALVFGIARPGASAGAAVLSVLFLVAKSVALHTHREIGCGCAVLSEGGVIGMGDLVFAVVLMVAAGFAAYHSLLAISK